MGDELYRQSMGLTFDPDRRLAEVQAGYSGSGDPLSDEESSFSKDGSDLMVVVDDPNIVRLYEIDAQLLDEELAPQDRTLLEAERIVRSKQAELDELTAEHPRYANALQAWLFKELDAMKHQDMPVDDEMYAEAEILGEFITEANAEHEDEALIAIAEHMKAIIEAQKELAKLRSDFHLAA